MKTKEIIDGPSIPEDVRRETIIGKLNELQAGEGIELIAPHQPEKLIRMLMEKFPQRYLFSPLQNGPEQWRLHIHVRQNTGPYSVDEYLSWDHDRLDAIIETARKDIGNGSWEDALARVTEFKDGLFRHIQIEEDLLFPAFEEASGICNGGPTMVMRDEHVTIKEAVWAAVEAVKANSQDDFEQHYANMLGVLTEHNMKEENILYPMTDNSIGDAVRDKLVVDLMLG